MRVVQFLVGSFGGAERFFVRLCSALESRGVHQLVIINDNADLVADVSKAGLNYASLKLSKLGAQIDKRTVARLSREFDADIVIAWMNRAARRLSRGKYVTVGRLGGYYPVKYYRNCDHLITIAPGITESCVDQGWPSDRIRLISNFCEPFAKSFPENRNLERDHDAFSLFAFGRFDSWKGFDTLIDAVAKVDDVTLSLAGKGPMEEDLRRQVSRLGLTERVKFLGWIHDRASWLARADICVVPSHHEPLGNVVLETWSSGCPIIAAASEGPSWMIEHGVTGYLVTPGNVDELSAAITFAKNNAELRDNWARAAYSRWQQEFSEDVICDQYIRFFQEVLGRTV